MKDKILFISVTENVWDREKVRYPLSENGAPHVSMKKLTTTVTSILTAMTMPLLLYYYTIIQ